MSTLPVIKTLYQIPPQPAGTNASTCDADLVECALKGKDDAFAVLYGRYRGAVYFIAARVILDSEEAHDATQEIFIKAYRSLAGFDRHKCSFYPWLRRLAINHAIDYRRACCRRAKNVILEASLNTTMPSRSVGQISTSPHDKAEIREKLSEICKGIEMLPELQKRIFVLRYFQDLKLEEIAQMERRSLGTVKQSLFRAIQTVRRSIKRRRARI